MCMTILIRGGTWQPWPGLPSWPARSASTVRTAARIHIFDQGRIIESGTHEELVALGGRYAQMYEVQARAYQPSS